MLIYVYVIKNNLLYLSSDQKQSKCLEAQNKLDFHSCKTYVNYFLNIFIFFMNLRGPETNIGSERSASHNMVNVRSFFMMILRRHQGRREHFSWDLQAHHLGDASTTCFLKNILRAPCSACKSGYRSALLVRLLPFSSSPSSSAFSSSRSRFCGPI